jgi:tetratricopeptide repeat protein
LPQDDLDRGLPQRFGGYVFGIVLGLLFGAPLGWLLKLRGPFLVLFVILSIWAMARFIRGMMTGVVDGTANFFLRMVWPSGDSTPYEKTYSAEQALAARGDIEGALKGYRMAMHQNPGDPEPRFRVAELLFRGDHPDKAVAFFREGRELAGDNRARELYATQRLIDLYLGPLGDDVRALVELRRLVERFPGTPEAAAARNVLMRMKAEVRLDAS